MGLNDTDLKFGRSNVEVKNSEGEVKSDNKSGHWYSISHLSLCITTFICFPWPYQQFVLILQKQNSQRFPKETGEMVFCQSFNASTAEIPS